MPAKITSVVWNGAAQQIHAIFSSLGFEKCGSAVTNGNICFQANENVVEYPQVKGLVLSVLNPDEMISRVIAFDGQIEADGHQFVGPGGVFINFQRLTAEPSILNEKTPIHGIDHAAFVCGYHYGNEDYGTWKYWTNLFQFLGFTTDYFGELPPEIGQGYSHVLKYEDVRINFLTSTSPNILDHINVHVSMGGGVQHLALANSDVKNLLAGPVEWSEVISEYSSEDGKEVSIHRSFSPQIWGPFFIELIQRDGMRGFTHDLGKLYQTVEQGFQVNCNSLLH